MEKRGEIVVPPSFAHEVTSEQGDAGQEWLDTLPKRFADACNEWDLTIDGEPMHGHLGLVFPVRRGKEKCALKISSVNDSSRHEALALATWNGNGAVKLLDAMGLASYFTVVAGADTFPVRKPNPGHLLLAIERAGGDPKAAVMVGDSRTDVATARAAGIPVIVVSFGYSDVPPAELEGDRLVERLAEVPAVVASLLRLSS